MEGEGRSGGGAQANHPTSKGRREDGGGHAMAQSLVRGWAATLVFALGCRLGGSGGQGQVIRAHSVAVGSEGFQAKGTEAQKGREEHKGSWDRKSARSGVQDCSVQVRRPAFVKRFPDSFILHVGLSFE